jgi:NAD(P)-dependent dehydrogenase (short-subunit alcohol dehydrogenase family)
MLRNQRTPHQRTTASLAGKTVVIAGATSGVGLAAAREVARFGGRLALVARDEARRAPSRRSSSATSGPTSRSSWPTSRGSRTSTAWPKELLDAPRADRRPHQQRGRALHPPPGSPRTATSWSSASTTSPLPPHPAAAAPHARGRRRARAAGELAGAPLRRPRPGRPRLAPAPYVGLLAYGASKTAQLLSVWEFADRLEGSGVTINAMHPGEVRSGIGQNNGPALPLVPAGRARRRSWRTRGSPASRCTTSPPRPSSRA